MSTAFTIKIKAPQRRNWLIAAGRGKRQIMGNKKNRRKSQKERRFEEQAG